MIIKNQRGIATMIFATRSEYFKTALNTAVGDKKRVIDVQECSAQVIIATFATYILAELIYILWGGILCMRMPRSLLLHLLLTFWQN